MSTEKPTMVVSKPHKPEPAEEAALNTYRARRAKRLPAHVKVTKTKTGSALGPEPDLAVGTITLMNAMGTASTDFMHGLLNQLSNAASQGRKPDETSINFMLAVVNGIGPRDEVEVVIAGASIRAMDASIC